MTNRLFFVFFTGREVTISVVKQLASNLGITQNAEPSHFIKDEEVSWKIDLLFLGTEYTSSSCWLVDFSYLVS